MTPWEQALVELEHHVLLAERLSLGTPAEEVGDVLAPWEPPRLDGPVPADLLSRARDLARRQVAVSAALESALAQSRDDLAALRRAAPQQRVHEASYVDVSA